MCSPMVEEAALSFFLDCADEADPTGASTTLLLVLGYSHQTRRQLRALGSQPGPGWADTLKIVIKVT